MDSQQLKHRQMVIAVPDPVVGQVKMPGIVAKLGTTPGSVSKAAPLLGEDTDAVLSDMAGYDADKIEELKRRGAI